MFAAVDPLHRPRLRGFNSQGCSGNFEKTMDRDMWNLYSSIIHAQSSITSQLNNFFTIKDSNDSMEMRTEIIQLEAIVNTQI